MHDIILINPKSNTLQSFDFLIAKSIPLSLGYIAAYLEEKNYNVKIIDEEIETISKERLLQLTSNKKQLFGISCLTPTVSRGYKLANLIKSVFTIFPFISTHCHFRLLQSSIIGFTSLYLA